jgi:hypothetical protein
MQERAIRMVKRAVTNAPAFLSETVKSREVAAA